MTEQAGNSGDEVRYYVYRESLTRKLCQAAGWLLGWMCCLIAKFGSTKQADYLIDTAIVLRRDNPGAVRAIGRLNALRGLVAIRRGQLLISGRIHETGPFANKDFHTIYHVAAPNKARALALIKRFEWDAIPASIQIEEGELDHLDSGAEGVLWVAPGRVFWSDDDMSHPISDGG